jgi:chemotaxis protein CheD
MVEIPANTALEEVRVNMAEMKVESKPVELVASVGSCIAVCLHDSKNMCGGLAHVMLPKSSFAPQEPLPAKFADTAIPALAKAVRALGGDGARLSAKIAGGANMFPNMNALNIGLKNIEAVKNALAASKIMLLGEDVGGSHGRRITFDIATGVATVRRFNGAVTKL